MPEADARRRYLRACANFAAHAALVDRWQVLDTQQAEPRLVAAALPAALRNTIGA